MSNPLSTLNGTPHELRAVGPEIRGSKDLWAYHVYLKDSAGEPLGPYAAFVQIPPYLLASWRHQEARILWHPDTAEARQLWRERLAQTFTWGMHL
jgi:hypothetical protein